MQNGTNCNTNGGNTQHHFGELRGIGHDKSVPYAYGINVEKYSNEHTVRHICQFIAPASSPKLMVLMYEIWRICDTNNTNRTSGK